MPGTGLAARWRVDPKGQIENIQHKDFLNFIREEPVRWVKMKLNHKLI